MIDMKLKAHFKSGMMYKNDEYKKSSYSVIKMSDVTNYVYVCARVCNKRIIYYPFKQCVTEKKISYIGALMLKKKLYSNVIR
jgi:hypothetical protein